MLKVKICKIQAFCFVTALMLSAAGTFFFSAGTETGDDLCQLMSVSDWYDLDDIRSELDGDYVLMNDLDDNSPGYGDLVATADGWVPIGDVTIRFTGTFDGNGFEIRDLYINRPAEDYVGLFGHISGGSVQNVGLTNADITGDWFVGTLVGRNDNGAITNAYATGELTGNINIGGLVGSNYYGMVSSSHTNVLVQSVPGGERAGGLLGFNSGQVSNTYAIGDVNGDFTVGGLVGLNQDATISKSYAVGSVSGTSNLGGLLGFSLGAGAVEDSFWDTETTGQATSAGGTGKTTVQMKNVATFTDVTTDGLEDPWDFLDDPHHDQGDEDFWHIHERINDGYPFLTSDPWAIYNWFDLHAMRNVMSGHYILMNDIDENSPGYHEIVNTPSGFLPIGTDVYMFTGSLHGSGYEIRDLFILRPELTNVGLFGRIQNTIIDDLKVSGSVSGNGWVGGLVGYSFMGTTTIERTTVNVHVTNINTSDFERAGGLIGIMHNGNRMTNCYAQGTVDGPAGAILGGLVGSIFHGDVIIRNCYSTGLVNGGEPGVNVGGLIGFKHTDAQVIDSYWDIETSGQDTSADGTPLTTDEMTGGRATATGAMEGFDFSDMWYITESYPELAVHYDINDHLEGQGTEAEPYQIETLVGLQSMRYALDACFALEADIDASETEIWYLGLGFRPVGDSPNSFLGSLDGNGHEIGDLYINRPAENYVGLFGRVHYVTIENLRVSGSITGDRWVGGVVGYSENNLFMNRTVTNVAVTGDNRVGGLIGVMHNGNRIHDCAAHGPANGPSTSNIGGLVGRIHTPDVIIETSYSTGLVNNGDPGDDVGGLVGFKEADAQVLNSFWGMDTSGQATSAGGTGKTTAEMQNAETFTNTDTVGLDEPWDIVVIAEHDMENDYPRLNWNNGLPVWYIEQAGIAVDFNITVDDISAGEQPVIEIFDAENQFGDPLNGAFNVTIEINGGVRNITLNFVDGEGNHTWDEISEAGEYTAIVTIDGNTGSDVFNVVPASLLAVTISSVDGQTTVKAGVDLMFTAEARDEYGNVISDDVTEFHWENAVDGVLNLETVGDYNVTASYGGLESNTITITVVPGDPAYIEISPQSSTVDAGDTQAYTAIAFDEFGNEIGDVTSVIHWSIHMDAGGSWSVNVYTSENGGTWTVTGDYSGLTDTAELTVVGEEPTSFMDFWWLLLLLLLIIVIIIIIVLLMKRGKKEEPITQPMQPYVEPPVPVEEPFGADEPGDMQPPEGHFEDEHVSPEHPPVDSPGDMETPPPPPED